MTACCFEFGPMSTKAIRQARILTRKLLRLSWRDRFLLLEALFCLALGALAIAVLPFAHLGWLASSPSGGRAMPHQRRLVERSRVRWAVVACTLGSLAHHVL